VTARKCQGCNEIKERDIMLKITRNHLNGEVVISPESKITGRSVYVCKNEGCISALLKKKRIEKNFKGAGLNIQDLKANLADKHRQ
jgi:predicted RNA-binding protein YlxR (DUF448 family)